MSSQNEVNEEGTMATFDVDLEHKDYIMKSPGKALREFRTNCGNVSEMLKAMSTSSLQPNMQISLMRRIG
ncbi:hypothetical protein Lal_00041682 [Lupinus albus]|nr:hypothetical protein Lal_00041682 [Lupinus albus]